MNAHALSWRAFPNTNYGGKEMGMEHCCLRREEVEGKEAATASALGARNPRPWTRSSGGLVMRWAWHGFGAFVGVAVGVVLGGLVPALRAIKAARKGMHHPPPHP